MARYFEVVVGLDLCGYAYSFKSDAKTIGIHKNWGGYLGLKVYQSPSSVLVDSVGKFIAYGFEAEDKYAYAKEVEEDRNMLLFTSLNDILHKGKLKSPKDVIASVDGTIRPSIDSVIQYLKDHVIDAISNLLTKRVHQEGIRWVLLVPNDDSKQFMQHVALKVLSGECLFITEHEAVPYVLKDNDCDAIMGIENAPFQPGTKYIILNGKDQTVDISVQNVVSEGKFKTVATTGGQWGRKNATKHFVDFIGEVLGKEFVNEFQMTHPSEWYKFIIEFQRRTQSFNPDGDSKLMIPISWSMASCFSKKNAGKQIDKHLRESGRDGVGFVNGMISLTYQVVKGLFDPVVKKIVHETKSIIPRGAQYIAMIGEFSEYMLLQEAVKKDFEKEGLKVLIPRELELVTLKGAVLSGHQI